jgi:microcompartment protein CcmK/EutM
VVISSDGSAARNAVGDPKSPARWLVVGIVDEKEPGVPL